MTIAEMNFFFGKTIVTSFQTFCAELLSSKCFKESSLV